MDSSVAILPSRRFAPGRSTLPRTRHPRSLRGTSSSCSRGDATLFQWEATVSFALTWQLFEIRGKEVMPQLPDDIILGTSSSIAAGVPPGIEARLTLQMVRSGHVLWGVEGAPPKRGWLMLPDPKESR